MPRTFCDGPLSAARGGVHLAVRVTPRAGADRIDGVVATPDGGAALKLSVTSPPADNRANAAVLRLIAREWRLRHSDLDLVAGATSRTKIVRIAGNTEELLRRLGAAIASLAASDRRRAPRSRREEPAR